MEIIKQIPTNASSGDTSSTENGISRNTKSFLKTEDSQFIHLWMMPKHDFERCVKIFSQNIHKNNFIINTILETHNSYDIIFIQELPWFFIYSIPSSMNKEGEELVKLYSHPNWITFSRNPLYVGDSSRVITYINARLSLLYFSLWKDIF